MMRASSGCTAGTVAVMLCLATSAAMAQTSTDTGTQAQTQTETTTTTTSITTTTPNTPVMGPTVVWDVNNLSDRVFDYQDITQARAYGHTDEEIAAIANIARLASFSPAPYYCRLLTASLVPQGVTPFETVYQQVQTGSTFPELAAKYGLSYSQVMDIQPEKNKIANYMTYYENTGANAYKTTPPRYLHVVFPEDMALRASTVAAPYGAATPAASQTIAQALSSMSDYSTLVSALKKAGLYDSLNGTGPFTVFAPTNAAFAKLSQDNLNAIMNDPVRLKTLLSYHVIPATITTSSMKAMTSPTSPATLQGSSLLINNTSGALTVNNAAIVQPDIQASNGVIQGVDTVLTPAAAVPAPSAAPSTQTAPPAGAAPSTTSPSTP